ncbi:FAD-dependent oxidoreductase [Natronohydrobacter thiooxidans]|jgi:NADH dehydrogenase|uniref:FAD-dependent oxidoreductase n=1 Tax=Natronohydrobacter thiooxidans TaxID=87172 RepID=UPI0008FF605A|nr:FAD-dependent oxidoreductase [Natronohydrobacter thiooxidans]
MGTGSRKRILVLGGGFAGMFAARELQRRVGRVAEIELINEVNYFTFQPLLPEVAAGSISVRDAVAPLRRLLPGVRVRQAQIYAIDLERRIVTIFQGLQRRYTEVSYDHLVLALGQTVDLSRIPGLAAHALTMKTLSDALTLRNAVIDKLEHADITALPEVKKELLTFTVIGGGFSGVETAGEMKELIDRSLVFYPNIDRSEVRVLLVEFADRLLGELPASLGEYTRRSFEKRGIEVRLRTGIREATGTAIETTDGELIGTRTLVATIGNAPSPLVARLALPNERGRLRADRTLRVEGHDNVWALGDAALIPLVETPSERSHYAPPTAQFAVREARTLAKNIAAALDGRPGAPFVYKSKGALTSLGARRGVAEVYGLRLSGLPAWLLWRGYYLSFVPGFATRMRVAAQWLLDSMVGRSTVQTGMRQGPGTRYVRYRAGDRVFEEGNRADGFYAVVEGAFELRFRDADGSETLRRIGPGGHFGERVLLGEGLRTGTVRAIEDSVVLVVGAEDFGRLTKALPALRAHFEHGVATGLIASDLEDAIERQVRLDEG